ncbi:hypothetical protein ACOMHN_046008 [Nucella lapillus]
MGNRQGAKVGTRPEFSNQHRIRAPTGKTTPGLDETLSPEHCPNVFQTAGVHGSPHPAPHRQGGGGGIFSNDSCPDVVSSNFQEDLYLTPCLPEEGFSAGIKNRVTDGGSDIPHVAFSHRGFHSPSANRRVLQPSDSQNRQDRSKEEFTAPEIFSDISLPASFHQRFCQQADVVTGISSGQDSSTAINNTAALCIERLENLKRNIQHCNTENLTHFNNTGFAQLHSGTDYDDYDNADHSSEPQAWAHRRNKSMSPKTAVALIQQDTADKFKAVRKLSEPSRAVHRTDSMSAKHTIPEAWSKSAENSPVIVRKALPNPGSPVIVQRTPSQSPSVERRFPANAPSVYVLSGHGVDSLDGSHTISQVHHNMLSKTQGNLEARETSFSIREKATAEFFLPHAFHSPVSVRKMPESPILRSTTIQHQGKSKEKELSNKTIGDRTMPASLLLEPCMMHYMRVLSSSSSCSSSLSESPNQKPPLHGDNTLPYILPSASSTSTSPTAIQFCPQPQGTPVRTCTMVSQPSTAVILATRESQGSLAAADVSMESPKEDSKSMGEKISVQKNVCTDSRESHASSSQTFSSAVTEDSIKEISQTAVFGSVSPKLLRHRRLVKESPHLDSHSDSQHTFPKHSHSVKITTTKTSPQTGEKTTAGFDEDESLAHLSQSAPSSFSCNGPSSSQRLVASDTSDTLSTDRDTSGSSKRESSTSTATDDTLTSFRTRSTADSADYDEFVLPATLVFFRSADKDPQHDAYGFESEQTTIKRKLTQRQLPGLQAEQDPAYPKTRKKRRKQLYAQPHMVSDTNDLSDSSTLKRHRVVRDAYSDDLSDDSDPFGSKDDISDFPSSRDDISDLPSSRDDISDLPSSRDDISNLPDIIQDKSACPHSKTDTSATFSTVTTFPDTSPTTNKYVFHRSDLHSRETPSRSVLGTSRSRKRNLTADDRTLATLADTFVKQDLAKRRSSSQDSSDRFLNSYERPGELKESGADFQRPHQWSLTFEKLREPHSDVPSPRSPLIRQDQQLPASSPLRRNPAQTTGDRHSCEQLRHLNVCTLYADDDDDDDEGKKLLLQRPESENMVVFSCTIYNSACQKRLGSQK